MNQETGKPKYIIVLGTTCSGSGAVYDYLAGRGDLYDPLDGEEYQLPQVPNGLMALEAAGQAFHPASADHALVQFENVVKNSQDPVANGFTGKAMIKRFQVLAMLLLSLSMKSALHIFPCGWIGTVSCSLVSVTSWEGS